jgi:hypothetical protein
MNRDRKIGTVLTVAGVLTLPFFIGIPLLVIGVVLLARGISRNTASGRASLC